MNKELAQSVIHEMKNLSIKHLALCSGRRALPLTSLLETDSAFEKYYWFEERSAAFFALGKSRRHERPSAIITTSGTAVGELLPAVMEAHYSGVALLVITTDRPRRFRGSGAPQTAEQAGIFGQYVTYSQDLALEELCDLSGWDKKGPAHLNICFEEPLI